MAWTDEEKKSISDSFLLQEIGDYILQENGEKIILEEVAEWTPELKHSAEWTLELKHSA